MWDGVTLCRRGADTASQYQPSLLRGTDLAVQPKILSSEENIYVTSTKKTSTRQRSSAAIMISSFKRLLRLMTCTAFHLHHLWDHHLCTRATLPTSGARLTERGWDQQQGHPTRRQISPIANAANVKRERRSGSGNPCAHRLTQRHNTLLPLYPTGWLLSDSSFMQLTGGKQSVPERSFPPALTFVCLSQAV